METAEQKTSKTDSFKRTRPILTQRKPITRKLWSREEHDTIIEAVQEADRNVPLKEVFMEIKDLVPNRTVPAMCAHYSKYGGMEYDEIPRKKGKKDVTEPLEEKVEIIEEDLPTCDCSAKIEKYEKRMEAMLSVMTPEQKNEFIKKMLMD